MRRATAIVGLAAGVFLFTGTTAAQPLPFMGPIDGQQVTPPVPTPAVGFGCYRLTGSLFTFEITIGGLLSGEVAAHIHGPAPPGTPGAPIVIPLPPGNPKIGFAGPLRASEIADLKAGLWYVNIHTSGFPGGEVRGQILPGSCVVSVEEDTWGRVKALYR